jgi:hypothetical protein
VTNVSEQGIMQRRTPDSVRSRVSGAFDSVVQLVLAVSFLLAGPAVAWLGAPGVYVVGGIAALASVVIAFPILRTRTAGAIEIEAPLPAESTEAATLPVS